MSQERKTSFRTGRNHSEKTSFRNGRYHAERLDIIQKRRTSLRKGRHYSDESQQGFSSGDKGMEFATQVKQDVRWGR